jgi:hypothetical protein
MTETPERPNGQQESEGNEASPSESKAAPQSSRPQSPQDKQEFYWRRQAEKLEKELAALRAEREAEVQRVSQDRDEAAARATEAEWRAERLSLIAQAGLPSELMELVPEGDPELVSGYLEKLRPIAEKLARPAPRGLTNTNPRNPAGSDDARLERLAGAAARGDRRALREYAHLRERVKPKR